MLVWLTVAFLAGATVGRADTSEVDKLLKDRPQLTEIIKENDPVWIWLDKSFRDTNGLPAIWSSQDPEGHYLANHAYNSAGQAIIMAAAKNAEGKQLGGEQVLSLVVFELLNARHRDDFLKVVDLAKQGKFTKAEFEEEMAKIEFKTAWDVKKFHTEVWIPYASSRHLPWDNDFWEGGVGEDFDAWYRTVSRLSGYPDDIYGPYYDKLIK